MNNNKQDRIALIDVRERDELSEVHMVSNNPNITIYNIPMSMLPHYIKFIEEIANDHDKTYLVCRAGKRSLSMKKKYFSNNPKIESYEGGIFQVKKFNNIFLLM